MCRPVLLILMVLFAVPLLQAEIYKEVDESGNITYSDTPRGDKADPVDLPPINSQPPTPIAPREQAQRKARQQQFRLFITTPENGAHIPAGQRDVQILVRVLPRLLPGYRLQAYLNGEAYGASSAETQWLLEEVFRGEHTLDIELSDPQGRVVARSGTVTFSVFRPTVNRGGG